jgi:AraC-like DNA-binding protein
MEYEEWRDAVCSAFVSHETVLPPGARFEGQLQTSNLGALLLAQVGGSAVQVVRTPRSIRMTDRDYIKVGVQIHGHCAVSQDGRDAILAPGDLVVYETRRPYRLAFERDFSMLVLMFPRELMPVRSRHVLDITARRISGQHGMGAVLSPFLTLLSARSLTGDVQPSIEVCDAVIDLVAATCRSEAEQTADSQPAAARQAHLLRIQIYIEEHLNDPSLDTAYIAEVHHVSARYLQKLFQEDGQTLRSWIRGRRLNRCQSELGDPQLRHIAAAAIGSRWGFDDAANFVRAFRGEFGTTPSAWRSSALSPRSPVDSPPAGDFPDSS